MYDWSKHKIGIVLSGGGAKGAYEIGCWDALAKAGLTFSASFAKVTRVGVQYSLR